MLAKFETITITFWASLLGAAIGIAIPLLLERGEPTCYDVIAALRGKTVHDLRFVMNSDGCLSAIYLDPKKVDDPRKSLDIK